MNNTPPTRNRKLPAKPSKEEKVYRSKRNVLLDIVEQNFDEYKDLDENHLHRKYSSMCHLKCSKQVDGQERTYFVKDASCKELMINQHLCRMYPDGLVATIRFPLLQETIRVSENCHLLCFEWMEITDRQVWTPVAADMQNVVNAFREMTGVHHDDDMGGNYYWRESNKTFLLFDFGDAQLRPS